MKSLNKIMFATLALCAAAAQGMDNSDAKKNRRLAEAGIVGVMQAAACGLLDRYVLPEKFAYATSTGTFLTGAAFHWLKTRKSSELEDEKYKTKPMGPVLGWVALGLSAFMDYALDLAKIKAPIKFKSLGMSVVASMMYKEVMKGNKQLFSESLYNRWNKKSENNEPQGLIKEELITKEEIQNTSKEQKLEVPIIGEKTETAKNYTTALEELEAAKKFLREVGFCGEGDKDGVAKQEVKAAQEKFDAAERALNYERATFVGKSFMKIYDAANTTLGKITLGGAILGGGYFGYKWLNNLLLARSMSPE